LLGLLLRVPIGIYAGGSSSSRKPSSAWAFSRYVGQLFCCRGCQASRCPHQLPVMPAVVPEDSVQRGQSSHILIRRIKHHYWTLARNALILRNAARADDRAGGMVCDVEAAAGGSRSETSAPTASRVARKPGTPPPIGGSTRQHLYQVRTTVTLGAKMNQTPIWHATTGVKLIINLL